ncbi:MYND-type zinc finger-containing chromatin reader ZMYND8-like [Sitodiplosis mosellana]|uniref:MYND-type zinc finger-containing chromatin reader ZMYND8-like n=1 Tax=Sitodiplosis mosellana TaxID=263140 RepID=UPI00244514A9|nr:MYND-type zinc finger-containing chromatin reader ZMYND8-like [Sitodiplosis mosellana]
MFILVNFINNNTAYFKQKQTNDLSIMMNSHDTFCWKCAKKNSTQNCAICKKSFHKKYSNFANDLCDECSRNENPYSQEHPELIPSVIHFLLSHEEIAPLKNIVFKNSNDTVKYIGLNEIEKKNYDSFLQLKNDVEWFAHHLKTKHFTPKMNKGESARAADMIVGYLNQEISNLLMCPECYENCYRNPDDSITIPCTKYRHLVIWADIKEYGCWPAKVMSINKPNMVDVRFFGDGTRACLPSRNCHLFSKEIPSNKNRPIGKDSIALFSLALKVNLCGSV